MCPAEGRNHKDIPMGIYHKSKKIRHILSKDNLILFMEVRPSDEHKLGYDV
jgi:hypothetical protein